MQAWNDLMMDADRMETFDRWLAFVAYVLVVVALPFAGALWAAGGYRRRP